MRRAGRWLTKVFGAAVLGVATILVPKVRADDHWSTSPVPTAEEPGPGALGGGGGRRRRRRSHRGG